MIWFCYLCKKKICFGHGPWGSCFCTSWAKKWYFLGVLAIFLITTGFHLKLLILIESLNIFHWKPAKKIKVGVVLGKIWAKLSPMLNKYILKKWALSIVFFAYFASGIPFKA